MQSHLVLLLCSFSSWPVLTWHVFSISSSMLLCIVSIFPLLSWKSFPLLHSFYLCSAFSFSNMTVPSLDFIHLVKEHVFYLMLYLLCILPTSMLCSFLLSVHYSFSHSFFLLAYIYFWCFCLTLYILCHFLIFPLFCFSLIDNFTFHVFVLLPLGWLLLLLSIVHTFRHFTLSSWIVLKVS